MYFLPRPSPFRIWALAFGGLLLSYPLPAQQRFVPAPHVPVAPAIPNAKPLLANSVPRSLVGGLWMIDPDLQSSIMISNKVIASAVTVTPTST